MGSPTSEAKDQRAKSAGSSGGSTVSDSPGSFHRRHLRRHPPLTPRWPLASIAAKTDTSEYLAAGGNKFFLWPGGTFARVPSGSSPRNWWRRRSGMPARCQDRRRVDRAAGAHLVSRSHSEPVWIAAATVLASEGNLRTDHHSRRRVRYAHIDPVAARNCSCNMPWWKETRHQGFFAHTPACEEAANWPPRLAAGT
jgi:hypothetical protein